MSLNLLAYRKLTVEFKFFKIFEKIKKMAFILRIFVKTEFKNSMSIVLENSSKFIRLLKAKNNI
jgi:hypothetical protein